MSGSEWCCSSSNTSVVFAAPFRLHTHFLVVQVSLSYSDPHPINNAQLKKTVRILVVLYSQLMFWFQGDHERLVLGSFLQPEYGKLRREIHSFNLCSEIILLDRAFTSKHKHKRTHTETHRRAHTQAHALLDSLWDCSNNRASWSSAVPTHIQLQLRQLSAAIIRLAYPVI